MKTKKDDILAAYNELIKKYEQLKENDEKQPVNKMKVKKEPGKEHLEESYTVETIVKDLADLKLSLNKTLTAISDRLISEVNTLEAIKKEIQIETDRLSEIHHIQAEADSLNNLVEMHEDKKREMEKEMSLIKEQWEKEQQEHDRLLKERDEQLQKQRTREQEEYDYAIAMKRKKQNDAFEEEKALLQKQIAQEKEVKLKDIKEREEALKASEEELSQLRKQVKDFPNELSKTIAKVRQETKDQIEKDMKLKEELRLKEAEGDKKVYELKIKNLEDTMLKQAMQIDGLSKQLDTSSRQVLTIANKAIEGASGLKSMSSFKEDLFDEPVKEEKTKK